jgi:hypothetical protein
MNHERILRETMERIQVAKIKQKNACELFLNMIAEQISFMQSCGSTSIKIIIPNSINRIPLDREYVFRKTIKKLRKFKYNVHSLNQQELSMVVSWG